jgi:predicted MFS family arabinose efflux permease
MPFGALLVLSMIGFTAITTELLPSGLLPQISSGLNVSEPVAGYLTAGYAAVIVATVIPAAMLLSRVPRHTLLVALVLTFAISNALVGLVSDFGPALAARLVGGIAHGLLWTAMAPLWRALFPPTRWARRWPSSSAATAWAWPSAPRWEPLWAA